MEFLLYFFAWASITGLIFLLAITLFDTEKLKGEYFIYASLSIILGFPVIYFILKFIFNLLMLWYYIFGIVLIFLGFISLIKPNVKAYIKSLIIILVIIVLYFFYDYRSILEINFDVKFDNEFILQGSEDL